MKVSFLTLCIFFFLSCNQPNSYTKPTIKNVDSLKKLAVDSSANPFREQFDSYEKLSSLMKNKVQLDTLLNKITYQEKVKIISELKDKWDDSAKVYSYYDTSYLFKLKTVWNKDETNSILFDRNKQIHFSDYKITCFNNSNCLSYGYNDRNSLEHPKVIEVCGYKFLYSNIVYNCNGKGCGCVLTMVYDLKTQTPTFIENYRVSYDSFFISDFNNDNNPDLLIIEKTGDHEMKGFEAVDFEINIHAFTYKNGKFVPSTDQYSRPIHYTLYGIGEYGDYSHLTYSIISENWFTTK